MPTNLSTQSNQTVALIQSAHELELSELVDFISKIEGELKALKSLVNQQSIQYSPELIKVLYETSDDARRIGGFLSLQRSPTEDTDRWALARLGELSIKVVRAQELIQSRDK